MMAALQSTVGQAQGFMDEVVFPADEGGRPGERVGQGQSQGVPRQWDKEGL